MSNIKRTDRGKVHLVIGDPHAKPGVSNKRFELLGKLIKDVKPDVVINIGDHADMPSLCSYDKGTKGFEGRRYKRDIDAAVDASEKLAHYGGAALRDARKVITIGNHENRINRATEADAALDGVLTIDDLEYDSFYDEVYPFLTPINIDGIYYSHYHTSGIMGRPISGEHPAYQLLTKKHVSCTVGHSHMFDYCRRTEPLGKVINGLVAGCYFEHHEDYAGPANMMWYRGIIVCKNVVAGDYDLENITLREIKRIYS